MANSLQRAEFWIDFICSNCQFPEPEKLRAQFKNAELSEFCNCGCNSFKVSIRPGVLVDPIAPKGKSGMVFEADFMAPGKNKTLEIILFANEEGNLAYVEVDYCANSCEVPEDISIDAPPYHVTNNLLGHSHLNLD